MAQDKYKLLWIGAGLEIFGLLLAIVSIVWFDRFTMLVLFAIGIPAIVVGMICYLIVVMRYMIAKGAL